MQLSNQAIVSSLLAIVVIAGWIYWKHHDGTPNEVNGDKSVDGVKSVDENNMPEDLELFLPADDQFFSAFDKYAIYSMVSFRKFRKNYKRIKKLGRHLLEILNRRSPQLDTRFRFEQIMTLKVRCLNELHSMVHALPDPPSLEQFNIDFAKLLDLMNRKTVYLTDFYQRYVDTTPINQFTELDLVPPGDPSPNCDDYYFYNWIIK